MNKKLFFILLILIFPISEALSNSLTVDEFIKMGKQVIAKGEPEWQVKIYKKYINSPEKLKVKLALITSYNGQEKNGKIDRHDKPCTLRTASANLIPQYYYVWSKYGLRQVLDTGAKSNDKFAQNSKNKCDLWVDYWYKTPRNPVDGWNKTPVIILAP